MALDPEGIVSFKSEGTTYRLFFGMRARKDIETHYDLPFFRAMQKAMPQLAAEDVTDKEKIVEAGLNLRLSDISKWFECGLGKHHPAMTEDQVDDLLDELGLQRATELLGTAIAASLSPEEDGGAAKANPPSASRKRKTGSHSLVTG